MHFDHICPTVRSASAFPGLEPPHSRTSPSLTLTVACRPNLVCNLLPPPYDAPCATIFGRDRRVASRSVEPCTIVHNRFDVVNLTT